MGLKRGRQDLVIVGVFVEVVLLDDPG